MALMGSGTRAIALNSLLYYVGWIACVAAAGAGRPFVGIAVGLAVVVVHLGLARRRDTELQLVLACAAIGTVVDGAQSGVGLLDFAGPQPWSWLPPPWILVIWMLFATTLRYAMRWLHGRWLLASAFGAIGGPLAFYAGELLGAVEFPVFWLSLGVLAIVWGTVMPLLSVLAGRFAGGDMAGSYRVVG